MTTTINASTSSGLVVTPDNSGNVLLQYNGVSTPAFSAYANATTSLTSGGWTKLLFAVEEYDTANCFASSRFTPTVAGYYQINGSFQITGNTSGVIAVRKNGAEYKYGGYPAATGANQTSVISVLVYCNGTTDYLELWAFVNSATSSSADSLTTYFQGCLLRGA